MNLDVDLGALDIVELIVEHGVFAGFRMYIFAKYIKLLLIIPLLLSFLHFQSVHILLPDNTVSKLVF